MRRSVKITAVLTIGTLLACVVVSDHLVLGQVTEGANPNPGTGSQTGGRPNVKSPVQITKAVVEVWAYGKGAKKPSSSDIGIPHANVESVKISGSNAYAKITVRDLPLEGSGIPITVDPGWPFNMSNCSYERISVSMELKANVNQAPESEFGGLVILSNGRLVSADPRPAKVNDNFPIWNVGVKDGKVTINGKVYGAFPEIRYVMEYGRGAGGGALKTGVGASKSGGGAGGVGGAGGAGVSSSAGKGKPGAGVTVTAGQYKTGESLFLIAAVILSAITGLYLVYRGLRE